MLLILKRFYCNSSYCFNNFFFYRISSALDLFISFFMGFKFIVRYITYFIIILSEGVPFLPVFKSELNSWEPFNIILTSAVISFFLFIKSWCICLTSMFMLSKMVSFLSPKPCWGINFKFTNRRSLNWIFYLIIYVKSFLCVLTIFIMFRFFRFVKIRHCWSFFRFFASFFLLIEELLKIPWSLKAHNNTTVRRFHFIR